MNKQYIVYLKSRQSNKLSNNLIRTISLVEYLRRLNVEKLSCFASKLYVKKSWLQTQGIRVYQFVPVKLQIDCMVIIDRRIMHRIWCTLNHALVVLYNWPSSALVLRCFRMTGHFILSFVYISLISPRLYMVFVSLGESPHFWNIGLLVTHCLFLAFSLFRPFEWTLCSTHTHTTNQLRDQIQLT